MLMCKNFNIGLCTSVFRHYVPVHYRNLLLKSNISCSCILQNQRISGYWYLE